MARCGCGGACSCALISSDSVTVTGSGVPANPWIPTVVTNCDEVRDCLSANQGAAYNPTTGVISVCVSPNGGNGLTRDANGCLFVGAGAATVSTGCGINGIGTPGDPVRVDAGAWPYACAIATQGGVVACDPATGQLYSEPRSRSVMTSLNEVQAFANVPVPTGAPTPVRTITMNVTNPDPCRAATIVTVRELEFDVDLPPNARVSYGFTGDDMVTHINRGATTENGFAIQVTKVLPQGTIAAGATQAVSWDAQIGNGTNGATYSNVQQIVRVLLITA